MKRCPQHTPFACSDARRLKIRGLSGVPVTSVHLVDSQYEPDAQARPLNSVHSATDSTTVCDLK